MFTRFFLNKEFKMKTISLLSAFILCVSSTIAFGQDSEKGKILFASGITVEYGIGNYAVTDEYISKEKYSGSLPFYKLSWTNPHQSYIYHLSMSFQNSSKIKSNNVSAEIIQFTFKQGFSYALPEFKVFGNDIYVYIGPSTELFLYYNKPKIAVSGFDYAQSSAMLISGNLNSSLYYPLSENFFFESSLDFSLLSLGFRLVDSEESDESPARILTVFSGTNVNFSFGARYYMFDNLSLKAAYNFHLTRISSWEPLLAACDNLIFSFTYGF